MLDPGCAILIESCDARFGRNEVWASLVRGCFDEIDDGFFSRTIAPAPIRENIR
jgi:hypothetical protein